jgi:hypothetical protein
MSKTRKDRLQLKAERLNSDLDTVRVRAEATRSFRASMPDYRAYENWLMKKR